MDTIWILPLTDTRATLESTGGKAASLARLAAAGLPVPGGFCVTTAAYRSFVAGSDLETVVNEALGGLDLSVPADVEAAAQQIQACFHSAPLADELSQAICEAYAQLGSPAVAVRSSATAEDLPEASFAGQQDTYLNIRGAADVLDAVRRCFASLWTARAIAYRARQGIAPGQVALAVVVQELVDATAAGILFTVDPLSGEREHMLVNAAWGLGEAVVGGLVTPDSFTLEKSSGRVITSQVADKLVQTIREDSGTREAPVPEAKRQLPSLGSADLTELARLGKQVEGLYGMAMDIEWAVAGGKVYLLQARPVTTLKEPAPPLEWRVPDPKGHWMRGSFIDFMPDPLTPLFESMLLPTYAVAMPKTMGLFRLGDVSMYQNYLYVFNHFPYLMVGYPARQYLELLWKLPPAIKPVLYDALPLWQEKVLPNYRAASARWYALDLTQAAAADLVNGASEIFNAAIEHLAMIQVATLGIAAGTEGIFSAVYNKLVRKAGDPEPAVFLLGFESRPIQAEQALFDLARWCAERPALADYLRSAPNPEILSRTRTAAAASAGDLPPGVSRADWSEWATRLAGYLDQFGYAIYNLDFAHPIPADDPAPLLETLRLYLSGQGKDPYARRSSAAAARETAVQATRARLRGVKAWLFNKTLGWAQKFGPLREDSIAEIGLGYPAIRRLLDELGRRLHRAGAVATQEDIYWLTREEAGQAATALDSGHQPENYTARITARRGEWETLAQITPPPQLPYKKKVLGMDAEMFTGSTAENDSGNLIRGLAASPGQVTATARVIAGPADFAQMQPGDVLIAAITTPAWTPLFAMASAIVTDTGGPLSHGSIVAREYGIPAVLGTRVATQRIHSGQRVSVDGTKGTVTITA